MVKFRGLLIILLLFLTAGASTSIRISATLEPYDRLLYHQQSNTLEFISNTTAEHYFIEAPASNSTVYIATNSHPLIKQDYDIRLASNKKH